MELNWRLLFQLPDLFVVDQRFHLGYGNTIHLNEPFGLRQTLIDEDGIDAF